MKTITYNAKGNQTEIIEHRYGTLENQEVFKYDAKGRLIEKVYYERGTLERKEDRKSL